MHARHRRGTPYPPAIRERVMDLLAEGYSLSNVAKRLSVSRATVIRYKNMARDQHTTIPRPKKQGGYRHSKLNREQIQRLSQLLVKHPKLALHELRTLAIQKGIFKDSGSPPPSIPTLWYVLHNKAGMHFTTASFRDPKTSSRAEGGSAAIPTEAHKFQIAQKKFSVSNLLFMDETNLTLNMQQHKGWAPRGKKPLLYRPKGKMMTYNMSVIIGVRPRTIYYIIKPPDRQYDPIPATFQAYEFADPSKRIQTGYTINQIRSSLLGQKLKSILKEYGVRNSNAKIAELRDRVEHLQTKGLVGLPRVQRRGGKEKGGPKKPFRSTIYDVVEFFDGFTNWWIEKKKLSKQALATKMLILDNASTHAAIRVEDTKHKSVFHRLARERWGLKNIIYQPPRSPQFQPAEVFFAFLKSKLRHYAPPDGLYTEKLMYKTIDDILTNQITEDMIRNWATGSGYLLSPNPQKDKPSEIGEEAHKFKGNACSMKEPLPKSGSIICADKNGTIVKRKLPGQTNWQLVQERDAGSDVSHLLKDIQVRFPPPQKREFSQRKAATATRFEGRD
jgi:transposase